MIEVINILFSKNKNLSVSVVATAKEKNINGEMVTAIIKCSGADKNPVLLQNILHYYGFDYNKPPAIFPYEEYLQVAEYLSERIYPELSLQDALESLGYKLTYFYFRTPTGQIMKNLAPVLGPYQGTKTYVANISKKFPWITQEIEELRPHYLRYHVREMPGTGAMFRGNIKALLEISGGKLKRISTTILGKEDWVLEVEWD